MGIEVAYLPGLAMRRIADLHPGNAKTDARDAYVIAEAARSMPHTLRRVDLDDAALAELNVLVGFDDDLAAEATRLANRIRGLLTQTHPPWRGCSARGCRPGPCSRCWRASAVRPGCATKASRRGAQGLVADISTALGEQTVVVPGTPTGPGTNTSRTPC